MAKEIEWDGIVYPSFAEAARSTGITVSKLKNALRKGVQFQSELETGQDQIQEEREKILDHYLDNGVFGVLIDWVDKFPEEARKPRPASNLRRLLIQHSQETGIESNIPGTPAAFSVHLNNGIGYFTHAIVMYVDQQWISNKSRMQNLYSFAEVGDD